MVYLLSILHFRTNSGKISRPAARRIDTAYFEIATLNFYLHACSLQLQTENLPVLHDSFCCGYLWRRMVIRRAPESQLRGGVYV